MSIILRWGMPALVTVVGGTWLAITATASGMGADLESRVADALAEPEFTWATVVFDARDARVTGTAGSEEAVDRLVATLGQMHGVRSVTADVVIAERVSPFPFVARVDDGALILSGGVPDSAARDEIRERVGTAGGELRVLAGAPPRATWRDAVDYALLHAAAFDEGEVSLSDLELTVRGRARDSESFESLQALADAAPAGVVVATREVAAPLASPFSWRAEYDGRTVSLVGFTPSAEFVDELRAAAGDVPVSTTLVLASGEPDSFTDRARSLFENLLVLEQGTAEISGDTASLTGSPAGLESAEAVTAALSASGVEVDLAPPRVEDYAFRAERAGDRIILSGVVPDAATRDRLAARPNVDVAALGLARGAPERFDSGVEFGLSLLARMSEGSFAIENSRVSVGGRAASSGDYAALQTAIGLGAPQGLILAQGAIRPPLVTNFTWSARKFEAEPFAIAGYVPNEASRTALHDALGGPVQDAAVLADGAPAGFVESAALGLGVLALMPEGTVAFDGERWTLSGRVAQRSDAPLVERAVAEAQLERRGWLFSLEVPELPAVEPYAWRAEKAEGGALAFAGYVPDEAFLAALAARADAAAVDPLELASGAPPNFADDALAGLAALEHLETGVIEFADGIWRLRGVPRTAADGEMALAALLAATGEGVAWDKELAEPIETPEPELAPEPEPAPADTPEPETPAVDEPAPGSEPVSETEPASDTAPDAEPVVDADPAPAVLEPEPEPEPEIERSYAFLAEKPLGGAIALRGVVPTEPAAAYLATVAGGAPADAVQVAEGLPDDFVVIAANGLRTLDRLHRGTFGLAGTEWVLAGQVETPAEQQAIRATLPTVPFASQWTVEIGLLPAIDVCREKVNAFAARNEILFTSGSARIDDDSFAALDELAAYLADCPEAAVNVEGHTDSDGDEASNLALSVARAEAVVGALIDRGVSFRRLYAVGYGQSLPIADNATSAGKRANRRIAFSFFDDADQ